MKVGDIVAWVPDYVTKIATFSLWLGVVVQKENNPKPNHVKVHWYVNQEGYHSTDWTSIKHLRLISKA